MSYLLTERSENVNWVYGFRVSRRGGCLQSFTALLMALFPIVISLPTHSLLKGLF
jgi:hypothetical protein